MYTREMSGGILWGGLHNPENDVGAPPDAWTLTGGGAKNVKKNPTLTGRNTHT